jgi:hypothetical protein
MLDQLVGRIPVVVSIAAAPLFMSLTTRAAAGDTAVDPRLRETDADVRASEVERRMTDDERFSRIVSLIGAVPSTGVPRVPSIRDGVKMSAGHTSGIPWLCVPAVQSGDASHVAAGRRRVFTGAGGGRLLRRTDELCFLQGS